MIKKTVISEFFTTISFVQLLRSLYSISLWLLSLRYGKKVEFLEKEFLMYLWCEKSKIISFYNWRSAIYQALKIINIDKKDEVIVSAYTCVSVVNAVIQSGWKLVYCDIEKKSLGIDPKQILQKITKKTKVIILQHTFWKPSNIKEIKRILKEKGILIIEDCAHSLWSALGNKKLWCFGDFAIFSTGRDKVISSVNGGFLLIHNKEYFKWAQKIKSKLIMLTRKEVFKNHMYNIFGYLAYKCYDFFSLWKCIMFLARKYNIINEIITKKERNCKYKNLNYWLPNSLAFLASKELEKIKLYSSHRWIISEFYNEKIKNSNIEILYKQLRSEKNNAFRYPILVKSVKIKEELYNYMRENNILLWNYWSWSNIVPESINRKNTLYKQWSCKVAEDISSRILTLPNHSLITFSDAERIINLINKFKI
jgi:dTDP-4-amino-4,6-dideoxygalactose transaminase